MGIQEIFQVICRPEALLFFDWIKTIQDLNFRLLIIREIIGKFQLFLLKNNSLF